MYLVYLAMQLNVLSVKGFQKADDCMRSAKLYGHLK